ncbi:MAG TPA: response regulator transcription factor [Gemmatimonadales bacterium]|nr:response regulator transcription factor [Gemmatimonadales bacterium]
MIRVALADDHPVVRQGIRQILEDRGDVRVVAEAGSAEEILTRLAEVRADVVLLDIQMPGPGILELLRQLRAAHPETRVLVVSMHAEEQYATRVLKAGAAGYVTKDRSPEELLAAIRTAYTGGVYVSPDQAARLARALTPGAERDPHESLSDREFEVLKRLGAGETVKEIGARLDLSPKTVSTYRARILAKLGLETNADLVRYLVEHGLDAKP